MTTGNDLNESGRSESSGAAASDSEKAHSSTKGLAVAAGHAALGLSAIGWVLRLIVLDSDKHPRAGIEIATSSQMGMGGFAFILLLVAGILGLYGAVRDDGRGSGVIAVFLSVAYFLSIMGPIMAQR